MTTKRKGRGPGKKPAMTGLSLRIPVPILDWYKETYPTDHTAVMRRVLEDFAIAMEDESHRHESQLCEPNG